MARSTARVEALDGPRDLQRPTRPGRREPFRALIRQTAGASTGDPSAITGRFVNNATALAWSVRLSGTS
jgi:hypothetical protein